MEAAEQTAVLLGGLPTLRPGLNVVPLAVRRRFVAVRMRAHAVPQLDGTARPAREEAGAHAHVDAVAQCEDGALEVGRVDPRVEGRRGQDGSVLELADAAMQRLVPDEDAEERCRANAVLRSPATTVGHLHQSVRPPLRRRAGQLVEPGRAAEMLLGLGAVGFEQLVLQAVQFPGDDRSRDRVERHLPEPHSADARVQEDRARRPALDLRVLGALGIRELLPVRESTVEVLEAHLGRLVHQHRLVPLHRLFGPVSTRSGDRLGLVAADPALEPGVGAAGKLAQCAAEPDPAPGRAPRDTTPRGDPRRRCLGAVGRPLLPGLERGHGLGGERLEARQFPVQRLDRRSVGEHLRIARHERVEGVT